LEEDTLEEEKVEDSKLIQLLNLFKLPFEEVANKMLVEDFL
jgi:hypothetical protein